MLHTIIEALTKDGRDISLDHRLSNIFVPKGLPEGQPIRELAPIENEIVLPKSSSGVFNSTAIDYVLKNMNIRYLVIAGVVTDQCVDMAVRDASDRGYMVSVAADACATYTQERHDAALRAFGGYGWITDTATITERFRALAHDQQAFPCRARSADDIDGGELRGKCAGLSVTRKAYEQSKGAKTCGWVPANMSLTSYDIDRHRSVGQRG